jgi:hypothetical protein
MKSSLTQLLPRLCSRTIGHVVTAALVVLLAVQVAVPPQLSGFDSPANWQEYDEQEEDGEPDESSGQQGLLEFVGPVCSGAPRSQPRFFQRIITSASQLGVKSRTNPIPAELANRNGAGGPLRC